MIIDLQNIRTRDGVRLDGGVFWPQEKGKTAIIVVHGLMSNGIAWLWRAEPLQRLCTRKGIAVAAFNTRGAHILTSLWKRKKRMYGGGAAEHFSDCVHDIRAMIDFFRRHGYREIVLAGHSTGANKIVYYLHKKKDRRVKKLILLGPMSDVAIELREQGSALSRSLVRAKQEIRKGRGGAIAFGAFDKIVLTPRRYLSLYTPGGAEDVFPYYTPKGNWRALESIRIPTLVVIGSKDQYLDRSVDDFLRAFHNHLQHFFSVVISGADHSFHRQEKELARVVMGFVRE